MQNKILQKLFSDDPSRQYRGQVIGKIRAGIWQVRDDGGRLNTVTSDLEWQPRIDWVVVQAGRIVGRAAAAKTMNCYEV